MGGAWPSYYTMYPFNCKVCIHAVFVRLLAARVSAKLLGTQPKALNTAAMATNAATSSSLYSHTYANVRTVGPPPL